MIDSEHRSSGYILSPQDGKCRAYDVGVDQETTQSLSELVPITDIRERTRQHTLEKGGIVNGQSVTSTQYLYEGGPLAYDTSKIQPSSQLDTDKDNTEKKERLVRIISERISSALQEKFPKLDESVTYDPESETGWIVDITTLHNKVLQEMGFGIDINYEIHGSENLSDEQRRGASARFQFVIDVFKMVNKKVQETCFQYAKQLFLVYIIHDLPNYDRIIVRLHDKRHPKGDRGAFWAGERESHIKFVELAEIRI